MRTIEPYLVAADAQAEIWPELEECCWQRDRVNEYTPPGRPIGIEEHQTRYFVLRPGAPAITPGDERYEDGMRRIRWVAGEIWRRWAGTDAVVLVSTHFHTGARLVEALTEQPHHGVRLDNAKFTHIREVDGRFILMGVNLDSLDLIMADEVAP
jgi:broad specificity phosphatase PhoE